MQPTPVDPMTIQECIDKWKVVCAVALVGCHKEPVDHVLRESDGAKVTIPYSEDTNIYVTNTYPTNIYITNLFTTNLVPPKPTEEWLREYARTNSARNAQ